MRSLSQFAFGIFLSTGGLFILAALDSTIFFFFPFGIDAAVIVLTVRHHGFAWAYPVLATAGSVAGTIVTFWMGRKIGEAGLERYVPKRRLASVIKSVRRKGATTLALFAVVPPPVSVHGRCARGRCARSRSAQVSRSSGRCPSREVCG